MDGFWTLLLDGFISGDVTANAASTIYATGDLVLKNGRVFSAPSLSNSGVIRGTGIVGAGTTNGAQATM